MIENIVFDLSEVLIPGLIGIEEKLENSTGLDKDFLAKALGSYPYYEVGNLLDRLNRGEVSYEKYRDSFLRLAELPQDYTASFDAVCWSMFEHPYDHTAELLQNTHAVCNLYLVSDHCEKWATKIVEHYEFFSCFKDVLWSFEIGSTKKHILPFKEAIRRFGIDPSKSLFVDDNEINIKNAASLSFEVVHFLGPSSVDDIYKVVGIDVK